MRQTYTAPTCVAPAEHTTNDSPLAPLVSSGSRPSVFAYDCYRLFLSDFFTYWKGSDAKVSHRYLAARSGASSAGWFSNIISGRISLTHRYLYRLARALHLSPWESEFLALLVDRAHARGDEQRRILDRRIAGLRSTVAHAQHGPRTRLSRDWYVSALHERLRLRGSSADTESLAAALSPPVSTHEAAQGLNALLQLGLVARGMDGSWTWLVDDEDQALISGPTAV